MIDEKKKLKFQNKNIAFLDNVSLERKERLVWMIWVLILIACCVFGDIQNPGLVEPSRCESCKIFTIELASRLDETGKKKDVLRTGHGLDRKKKEIKVTIAISIFS